MRRWFDCVGSPQAEPSGFDRTLRRQLAFDRPAGQADRAKDDDIAKKRETPMSRTPAPETKRGAPWAGFSLSRGSS
jgi:hypothetical protein